MKELKNFIKQVSLVMTDTVDRDEFCYVDFNLDNYQINKDNAISLRQLLELFKKLYLAFKPAQECLERLNLGKSVEVMKYRKRDNNRYMIIYVKEPTGCPYSKMFICMLEKDNHYSCFFTNCRVGLDNYYKQHIQMDKKIIKEYLDLFEKHKYFIELYYGLKNNMVFGNGTTTLGTSIQRKAIQDIDSIRIAFGNSYFNYEDFILIESILSNDLKINYEQCEIILESVNLPVLKENVDQLLDNVYINKKYIKSR